MLNLLTKTAQVTYVPGVPGQAYRPPYCVTVQRPAAPKKSNARFGASSGSTTTAGGNPNLMITYRYSPPTPDPLTGQLQGGGWFPVFPPGISGVRSAGGSTSGGSGSALATPPVNTTTETTCYPEVPYIPAIPAYIITSDIVGWNGGARSIDAFVGDGYYSFTIPGDVGGALVGLSDGRDEHSYTHASHAFRVQDGDIAIVESGQLRTVVGPAPAAGDYRVVVGDSRVRYFVDGAEVYTSSVLVQDDRYLDATLFVSGDSVYNPKQGDYYEPRVTMDGDASFVAAVINRARFTGSPEFLAFPTVNGVRRRGVLFDGVAVFTARPTAVAARAVAMSGDASFAIKSRRDAITASAPALTGLFAETASAAVMEASAPLFTGTFTEVPIVAPIAGMAAMPPTPQGAFLLVSVGDDPMDVAMPAPTGLFAEEDAMVMDGIYYGRPTMLAWEDPYGNDVFQEYQDVVMVGWAFTENTAFVTVYDTLEVGAEASLTIIIDEIVFDAIAASDQAQLARAVALIANDALVVNNNAQYVDALLAQYAVNADSAALSRYEGFEFRGFTHNDGQTWAWNSTGVYAIGDAEETVDAAIDFGSMDFGTAQLKHMPDVFMGVDTDGEVYLRAAGDDGVMRTYRAVGTGAEKRARLGRGLRARQWRFQLEIVEATVADVLDIEFNVKVAGRRQGRRV